MNTPKSQRSSSAPGPAGRQHGSVLMDQLGNHRLLTLAKPLLALNIEDPGDIGTSAHLDLAIGVLEGVFELFGKQTPDGAFSSTHRAYQKDVTQEDYLASVMAPLLMIRGVRKISSSVLLSAVTSRRNIRPSNGRSPRKGTFS